MIFRHKLFLTIRYIDISAEQGAHQGKLQVTLDIIVPQALIIIAAVLIVSQDIYFINQQEFSIP